jgi:hypothetical protein
MRPRIVHLSLQRGIEGMGVVWHSALRHYHQQTATESFSTAVTMLPDVDQSGKLLADARVAGEP